MLLIGKPGSGKTTLLKQLLTNNQMYYRKFDEVLFVSPSHAKMGIPLKKENT
ncbi:MAG: NB-ARC domain-containing protein [bacterium]|jgi:ABC-type multidrug transport system ATPase subunit